MTVFQFKTTLHNGVLKVPEQYSALWEGKPIRVTIVDDETNQTPTEQTVKKLVRSFQAITLNTSLFKFDRQEANER